MVAESGNKRKISTVELLLAVILFLLTIVAITPPKQTPSKESVVQVQKSDDTHLAVNRVDFYANGFLLPQE
ncbi:TPA: hypothetical protein ENX78_05545 [Candidatus Poribacteria bacterium]|nr:hypothetical protein [Candidatus Poribacteria bacterium]